MRTLRKLRFVAAAVLGAAIVVLPAAAASETTPRVVAENVGLYTHYWTPMKVTVQPDGTVEFANPTAVPHGIHWVSPPGQPACGESVPVGSGESASATNWSGSCTFTQPGTYTFYCTVHGPSMSGTVVVQSSGTTTTTTTTTPTGTTTGGGTGGPGTGTNGTTGTGGGASTPAGGAAAGELRLHAARHGGPVSGTVLVSAAGAGGRLTVELLASRASLAAAGAHGAVAVGRFSRAAVAAGQVHFKVSLNARGRAALRRHGRLAVTIAALLTPPQGAAVRLTGRATLRR